MDINNILGVVLAGGKSQRFGQDKSQVKLQNKLLDFYNQRGAEYPAEHNVGHEYKAKKSLVDFYKKLDPTNSFNPGIGNTSKSKYWN